MLEDSKRKKYEHEYYLKHKEDINRKAREWRKNNPDKIRDIAKRYRENHREEYNRKSLEYRKRTGRTSKIYRERYRLRLFEILGGTKCVICGFDDIRALQFDHKNGGGLNDRKRLGFSTDTYYKYYVEHDKEAIANLQVLCSNCNWIKRHINNENANLSSE